MTTRDIVSYFGEYLDYFDGIEYDDFVTLQPDDIKDAITELIPRIKFKNLYKSFMLGKKAETVVEITTDKADDIVDSFIGNSLEAAELSYATGLEPIFDEEAFTVSTPPIDTVQLISSTGFTVPTSITIKTVQGIIDIPNIRLKIIITNYMKKPVCLSDYERIVVAKAIIHELLVKDFDRVINRTEFIDLAKLITELFPLELLGTYYIPAVKSQQAQGKLYSAYQNYKADLREASLVRKRAKVSSTREERPVQLAEKSEAFKILLEECDDFDRIQECWKFCYEERQQLLNELSVFEFTRKFPAFSLPRGYELLVLDANRLLGSTTSKLADVASKIILYVTRKKRNTPEVKDLLASLRESTTDLDDLKVLQQLTAIRLLPHIMPMGKKKLNKTTVAKLFCPFFKTESLADQYNAEFKEDYKESSLVLKPRLYFFGEFSSPKVQVYYADQKYVIDNCLDGFDTLFKCFLGLNCSYPEETQHLWQFIQSELYAIESGNSKQSATTLTFINDIKTIGTE